MMDISGINEHRVGDGLPPRCVFVDGVEVDCAIYANISAGVVKYYPFPYVIKDDFIVSRTITGCVKVELKR
jgi:hypothetical protein